MEPKEKGQAMIRVCPGRDAVCPHGIDCPYGIDRYECKPEGLKPVSQAMTDKVYFPPKEFDPMCIFTCSTGRKLVERFKSERERADRAEAEVERLRELLKPVELMELGFQNVREGCVWMLHPEDAPADYDEVVRATLNGESNE
jgi:hypothetical protein